MSTLTHTTTPPPTTGEATTSAVIAGPGTRPGRGHRRGEGRPLSSPQHRNALVLTTAVPPNTGQVAGGIRAGA